MYFPGKSIVESKNFLHINCLMLYYQNKQNNDIFIIHQQCYSSKSTIGTQVFGNERAETNDPEMGMSTSKQMYASRSRSKHYTSCQGGIFLPHPSLSFPSLHFYLVLSPQCTHLFLSYSFHTFLSTE